MSCNSVKRWENYTKGIKGKPFWPEGAPCITCIEDLTMAAKAVRKSFRLAARSLKNVKGGDCFNEFDKWKYGDPVWFRGEYREEGWSLVPSIFRPEYCLKDKPPGYKSAEKWMLNEFWRKAVLRDPFCPKPERLDAWLALAQHHRLPTRLLDWTESILMAAWFAVNDDERKCLKDKNKKIKQDRKECVIWALSPSLLNWHFTQTGPFFFLQNNSPIVADAFTASDSAKKEKVIAIWMQDVHPRMLMQSGVFTIHSTDESLETLSENALQADPAHRVQFLRKLIVRRESISQIRQDLAASGVNASTVFPDLDHLAQDISGRWAAMVEELRGLRR